MVAFFQSLPKTLAAGVVLLIVIVVLVGLTGDQFVCSSTRAGRSSCAGCTS
jgi:hypothetical protein